MKAITLLASILITCISCNCQKKAVEQSNVAVKQELEGKLITDAQNDMRIEYEANTRGFYQKIIIQNQSIAVSKDRDGKDQPVPTKISDADWNEIISLSKQLDLEGLSNLKAPTEKRFYDGAPIANFRVSTKDKTYESAAFDGGFPPAEIEKIVNKIVALAEKQE